MENENGEIIHHDEYGTEYVLDEAGNRRPPMHTRVITSKPGEFLIHDTSQGHCALCGSLVCRGNCFK